MSSSTIKTILNVLGVLEVLGCLVIGIYTEAGLLTLVYLLAGFIMMVTLFAFGNLLEDIENCAKASMEIIRLMKENRNNGGSGNSSGSGSRSSNSGFSLSSVSSGSQGSTWRCSVCGEVNPNSVRICKGCGKDK